MYQYTEEQNILQQNVRDFVKQHIEPVALQYDQAGEFPAEVIDGLMEMGLHCMAVPEEFGGIGLDAVSCAIILEELSKGCAGIGTIMAASSLGTYPVMLSGNAEQKQAFADILLQGKLAAFCLTEPHAGSDAASIKTTAVRDGDDYIINGTKCYITNGGVAGVYSVFATSDPSKGAKGMNAFMVDRNTPGISIGREEDKMGIRCSNTTEVIFKDVRVPATNRLGKEFEGFKVAMKTLDASRPMVGALSVGIGQAALEASVTYAKEREQFGKLIGRYQAVQMMIADMVIQVEAARAMVHKACALKDADLPYTKESAISKCLAGDVAMQAALDAVQIHGGNGYVRAYGVEKLMRDAKIMQIFEGTNQIQRLVIAGQALA